MFLLSSYWSKFHVNIITGSGFMTIFFYKGLTRNLKIGNIPTWFLPNIWRPGWVRDIKLTTYVSNEMLLSTVKYQGYSFYCFWVGKIPPALPIEIRAKNVNGCKCRNFFCCLVVIYYFETVLKNFGKWYCYRFHTFHQVFYKNFVILVFWISALHLYQFSWWLIENLVCCKVWCKESCIST